MEVSYRKYTPQDYASCEQLVNQAWLLDDLFKSKNLQRIAKYFYTKGAIVSSNYQMVACSDTGVVGFIFGFNKSLKSNPVSTLLLGLRMTLDLNFKKMDKAERDVFVTAIKKHHVNRLKVRSEKSNEIVLFVVSPDFQGAGIGSNLWLQFKQSCDNSGESEIIVETNKAGASKFYEQMGFRHRADFDSPLHNLATDGGQACIYEYALPQID